MTDQKHTIGNIVQLTTGQVGDTNDAIWINESEELSNLRAQLNIVKNQRDELRDALEKIVLKTEEKNRNAEMLIGEIRYFASNVLTKTKGAV